MAALSTGTYGTTPDATMDDGCNMLAVPVPPGLTTINGALIALMQDSDDGPVTAELRIDGPPVP
jgi:hypothetical protein